MKKTSTYRELLRGARLKEYEMSNYEAGQVIIEAMEPYVISILQGKRVLKDVLEDLFNEHADEILNEIISLNETEVDELPEDEKLTLIEYDLATEAIIEFLEDRGMTIPQFEAALYTGDMVLYSDDEQYGLLIND